MTQSPACHVWSADLVLSSSEGAASRLQALDRLLHGSCGSDARKALQAAKPKCLAMRGALCLQASGWLCCAFQTLANARGRVRRRVTISPRPLKPKSRAEGDALRMQASDRLYYVFQTLADAGDALQAAGDSFPAAARAGVAADVAAGRGAGGALAAEARRLCPQALSLGSRPHAHNILPGVAVLLWNGSSCPKLACAGVCAECPCGCC